MKAEEYFNKNFKLEAKKGRTYFKPASWVFEFAEVYHKAEIKASFEEIYNVITYYGIDEPKASVLHNQIKNQLLNK